MAAEKETVTKLFNEGADTSTPIKISAADEEQFPGITRTVKGEVVADEPTTTDSNVIPGFSAEESNVIRTAKQRGLLSPEKQRKILQRIQETQGSDKQAVTDDDIPVETTGTIGPVKESVFDKVVNFVKDTATALKENNSLTQNLVTTTLRSKQYTPEYDQDGNLVDVRKETDEEMSKRVQMETSLKQKRRKVEEGSGADITAKIIREATDPLAVASAFVGIGEAALIARTLKLAASGSAYEGAAAATEQLVEDGDITNGQEVINRAVIGGVALPVVDQAFRWIGTAINKHGVKKATKQLQNFESKITEHTKTGVNPTEAMRRAADELGLNANSVTTIIEKAGRKIKITRALPDAPKLPNKTIGEKVFKAVSDSFVGRGITATKDATIGKLDPFIGVLSTRIKKVSEPIYHSLRQFEMDVHIKSAERLATVRPFVQQLARMKGAEKEQLKKSLLNSDTETVTRLVAGKGDLSTNLNSVKVMLDDILGEMQAAGVASSVKEFFPRMVKDLTGLKKAVGQESASDIEAALRKAASKKGAELTSAEQADAINKVLLSSTMNSPKGITNAFKERTIANIPDRLLKYYAEPEESIQHYINTVTHNLEKRKFFGRGASAIPEFNENIEDSIGSLLQKEMAAKNINLEDADNLKVLLRARFGAGEKSASTGVRSTKNVFYAITLANPVSAATQLGDLGISAFVNGLGNTLRTLPKVLTGNRELRMEDFGLNVVAEEMADISKTARALDKLLDWSGFKTVDRLGKETLINGSLLKHRRLSQTAAGQQKIKERFSSAFEADEMEKVITDLQAGRITPDVKFMMWSDLSDAQPVSLSELPEKYLTNPNIGRMLYMLQTFTIKQLDIMRRNSYELIKKGKVAEGAGNLIRFGTLFTAANMGSAQVKEWMLGRDVPMDENLVSHIYRLGGTSEYLVDKLKKGEVKSAAADVLLTPFSVAERVAKDVISDIENLGQQFHSLQHVPLFGRILYNWFGGGIEEFGERQEKKQEEYLNE